MVSYLPREEHHAGTTTCHTFTGKNAEQISYACDTKCQNRGFGGQPQQKLCPAQNLVCEEVGESGLEGGKVFPSDPTTLHSAESNYYKWFDLQP